MKKSYRYRFSVYTSRMNQLYLVMPMLITAMVNYVTRRTNRPPKTSFLTSSVVIWSSWSLLMNAVVFLVNCSSDNCSVILSPSTVTTTTVCWVAMRSTVVNSCEGWIVGGGGRKPHYFSGLNPALVFVHTLSGDRMLYSRVISVG